MLDIEAMKKRCEAATPGPWLETFCRSYQEFSDGDFMTIFGQGPVHKETEYKKALRDAEFIAAARTDLPAAIEAIEKMRKVLEDCAKIKISVPKPAPDGKKEHNMGIIWEDQLAPTAQKARAVLKEVFGEEG